MGQLGRFVQICLPNIGGLLTSHRSFLARVLMYTLFRRRFAIIKPIGYHYLVAKAVYSRVEFFRARPNVMHDSVRRAHIAKQILVLPNRQKRG